MISFGRVAAALLDALGARQGIVKARDEDIIQFIATAGL